MRKARRSSALLLVGKDAEDSADIAAVFFDLWRDAHPDDVLEDVPADLVTASASGLDPHITLKNALYQLPRVAGKWAEFTGADAAKLRRDIETLLQQHARGSAVRAGWRAAGERAGDQPGSARAVQGQVISPSAVEFASSSRKRLESPMEQTGDGWLGRTQHLRDLGQGSAAPGGALQ